MTWQALYTVYTGLRARPIQSGATEQDCSITALGNTTPPLQKRKDERMNFSFNKRERKVMNGEQPGELGDDKDIVNPTFHDSK